MTFGHGIGFVRTYLFLTELQFKNFAFIDMALVIF
jgi:hypothetical protein